MTDLNSDYWTSETNEITTLPEQDLTSNRSVNTIRFKNNIRHSLNLHGYKLTFGEPGIIFEGNDVSIVNGSISSFSNFVNIHSVNRNRLRINASIVNNGWSKVGLFVSGFAKVHLEGNRSNTFTGETLIAGGGELNLDKKNGSIAVSGNMKVKAGAKVVSRRSGQIAKHVNVTLESRGSGATSQLTLENGVQEKFHTLRIDGKGIVEFKGASKLIIDDLDISSSSRLTVAGWEHGKGLFLVRKTSAHIQASLGNITFQGQGGRVHLEDYNKDYWELTTAPEPAATGAIIGIIIAGITIRRNRLKKRRQSLSASVPI